MATRTLTRPDAPCRAGSKYLLDLENGSCGIALAGLESPVYGRNAWATTLADATTPNTAATSRMITTAEARLLEKPIALLPKTGTDSGSLKVLPIRNPWARALILGSKRTRSRRSVHAGPRITSWPPMNGRKTFGTITEPSAC